MVARSNDELYGGRCVEVVEVGGWWVAIGKWQVMRWVVVMVCLTVGYRCLQVGCCCWLVFGG